MQVVSRVQKLARKKDVRLTTHLLAESSASELDVEVNGDEELLDSMLENFIENAVKYAPSHSLVELELKSVQVMWRSAFAIMGRAFLLNYGQRYLSDFNACNPPTDSGSGLGLSIASEIANLHRVEIDLNGGDQGGTRVSLKFPRA